MAVISLQIEVDKRGAVQGIKSYNKELDKVKKSSDAVSKQTSKLGKSFKSLMTGWLGATVAIAGLTKLIKGSVDAFLKQEKAEKDLAAAMENTGNFTRKAHQELLEFAASRQKVTTYGDELTLQNMALLQSFQMNTTQIKKATIAAQDFASGLGVDLRTAALLVGKAFAGDTATLSRYGIKIEEGLSKSQKFEAVLKQINERFGGRARAEIDTYAGKVKQLSNLWGDFTEKLGKIFIPVLTKLMKGLTTIIEGMGKAVEAITTKHDDWKNALVDVKTEADKAGEAFKTIGTKAKETTNEIKAAFEKLDIFPKSKLDESARELIMAFRKAMEGVKTESEALTLQAALFEKLRKINEEAGKKAFKIGFDDEEIKQKVISSYDAVRGATVYKLAEITMDVENAGKTIGEKLSEGIARAPEGAIKKIGDTTIVTLEKATFHTEKFIQDTLDKVNQAYPAISSIALEQSRILADEIKAKEQEITEAIKNQNDTRYKIYIDNYGRIIDRTSEFVKKMKATLNEIPTNMTGFKSTDVLMEGSYANGLDFVPRDMNVRVHRGERIQKATENPYNPITNNYNQNFTFNGGQQDDEFTLERSIKRAVLSAMESKI